MASGSICTCIPAVVLGSPLHCKEQFESYIEEIKQKTFSATSMDKKKASAKNTATAACYKGYKFVILRLLYLSVELCRIVHPSDGLRIAGGHIRVEPLHIPYIPLYECTPNITGSLHY